MSFGEVDHVVILVEDFDAGIEIWRDKLGLILSHKVKLVEPGIWQAFLPPHDGTFIELIAPTHASSHIAGWLEAQGEGVHVVAVKVDDIAESGAIWLKRGVKLIGIGTPQVFVHPKLANSVILQLRPKHRPHRWRDSPRESNKWIKQSRYGWYLRLPTKR